MQRRCQGLWITPLRILLSLLPKCRAWRKRLREDGPSARNTNLTTGRRMAVWATEKRYGAAGQEDSRSWKRSMITVQLGNRLDWLLPGGIKTRGFRAYGAKT